jgi:NitT/TauT family transport system ATP-binding protein
MADLSPNLLSVDDVRKEYAAEDGARPVLDGVSFDLGPRDTLAVIGPSGCGKTTLLLMIAGLVPFEGGRILLKGNPVKKPVRETGLVLQNYGLFPWKTARRNIALGAKVQKRPVSEAQLDALEAELGLEGTRNLYPQQLSGGQRQRVALGRALLLRPELLLLDEPFAALDAMTRERLQRLLLGLFYQRSFSYVIVTHAIEEAVILGRRIMVLMGSPARVAGLFDNPTFGRPDPRTDPDFFNITVRLRRLLGDGA